MFAAIIDIGATWMSDLKEGICLDAFWFNREQCCWSNNSTSFDTDVCDQVRMNTKIFFQFVRPLFSASDVTYSGE